VPRSNAIERAGDDAEMVALLGWTHWFDSISGWTADAASSYRLAANCASRAMACNRGHPSPHNLQGKVLLWRMQHEAALEQLRRAVTISPSSAYAHFNLGDASMWCGRCEEALAHLDRAMRLDPNDHGFSHLLLGARHPRDRPRGVRRFGGGKASRRRRPAVEPAFQPLICRARAAVRAAGSSPAQARIVANRRDAAL
jgi:tetratricopeptide (TPR) repeat protein